MNKVFRLGMIVALIALAAFSANAGTSGAQASNSPAALDDVALFVPLVFKNVGNIHGRVTEGGVAAAGVSLDLNRWDGSTSTKISTTTTDAKGYYRFWDAPTLNSGESYYVFYNNNPPVASRLAYWFTHDLTSYTAGSAALLENFDIANVILTSPSDLSTVALPATFNWVKRSATPDDSYEFYLYSNDSDPDYVSGKLGYVEQYTLTDLPAGFNWNTQYEWDISIYGAAGGFGSSYQVFDVTFTQGTTPHGIWGRVTDAGLPAAGVNLLLRFWDGSAYSTAATTTTDADGYYQFLGAAALGDGQEYYVRYGPNNSDPTRLWGWWSVSLLSYPVGGADVHLEDFDIANIPLVSPASGSTVTLPYTFYWTKRPATPTDSYEWDLYSDQYNAYTSLLGYVDGVNILSIPSVFPPGVEYYWDVWVYGPGGGAGECFEAWYITFTNTGQIESVQLSTRPAGAEIKDKPMRGTR